MGTNYYLHTPEETLHIGKSSGGWCFALHVIPENGLNTLVDWKKALFNLDNAITNEYGDTIFSQEMLKTIIDRAWSSPRALSADFHALNYSEPGPNGLVRCKVDGVHCIGHGEGTWDYVTGDFS